MQALRESVDAALKRTFRPDCFGFLNRVAQRDLNRRVFHPLTQEQIVEIVALMVRDVQKRLEEREITFELTQEASLWLAKEGFDPVYGARPLRRAIQRQLENPLARQVLSGALGAGSHVVVDAGREGITLTAQAAPAHTGAEPLEAALV